VSTPRGSAERELSRLFTQRYGSFVGLARVLLDEPDRAPDVVLEAFARTLETQSALGGDDVEDRVYRYMIDIAHERTGGRFTDTRGGGAADDAFIDLGRREVMDAVRALPRNQKASVTLAWGEERSTVQIARILAIPESAAALQLRDGVANLADRLGAATVEDRVRDALMVEAASATPSTPPWGSVVERSETIARRRRSRRLMAVAGGAVVALVAAMLFTNRPDVRDPRAEPPATDPPAHVVAVTATGRLQILRTADGTVVRTVRSGIGPSRANITVSPDGLFAYLDREADGDCPGASVVERVDLASGATQTVADGRSPVLTHDGTHLAYVTASSPRCDLFDTLVVRRLADDTERRWPANRDEDGWGITYLRWSLDDRSLAFTLLDPQGYSNRVLDVRATGTDDVRGAMGTDLAGAQELSLPAGYEPTGFLENRETLAMLAPPGGAVELYAVAPDRSRRRLVTRADASISLAHITIDRDGEHVLWLERPASKRNTDAPARLLRLGIGARDPVQVAAGIVAAAWLERIPPAG
jgi:DNA-directed RNA polymerase specialized sigma24 family protein